MCFTTMPCVCQRIANSEPMFAVNRRHQQAQSCVIAQCCSQPFCLCLCNSRRNISLTEITMSAQTRSTSCQITYCIRPTSSLFYTLLFGTTTVCAFNCCCCSFYKLAARSPVVVLLHLSAAAKAWPLHLFSTSLFLLLQRRASRLRLDAAPARRCISTEQIRNHSLAAALTRNCNGVSQQQPPILKHSPHIAHQTRRAQRLKYTLQHSSTPTCCCMPFARRRTSRRTASSSNSLPASSFLSNFRLVVVPRLTSR
jgi:hypothetical protein